MYRLVRTATGFVALSLFCLFGAVQPCPAQSDLSGYWDVHAPNPSGDGTWRDIYFEIQQSGETLSGTLIRRPKRNPHYRDLQGWRSPFRDGAAGAASSPGRLDGVRSPAAAAHCV